MVVPPGIEPGSTALQTAAMTTSAKAPYRNTLLGVRFLLRRIRFVFATTPHNFVIMCFYMVGPEGFEPSPGGLKVCCAKPLTLRSHIGPSGRIRTVTCRIKSPLCYHNISKGWCIKFV